nr:hypothetical protein Iba_chr08bCG12810 [Ipomoea batatas]
MVCTWPVVSLDNDHTHLTAPYQRPENLLGARPIGFPYMAIGPSIPAPDFTILSATRERMTESDRWARPPLELNRGRCATSRGRSQSTGPAGFSVVYASCDCVARLTMTCCRGHVHVGR